MRSQANVFHVPSATSVLLLMSSRLYRRKPFRGADKLLNVSSQFCVESLLSASTCISQRCVCVCVFTHGTWNTHTPWRVASPTFTLQTHTALLTLQPQLKPRVLIAVFVILQQEVRKTSAAEMIITVTSCV